MVLLPSVFGPGGLLSGVFLDPVKILWTLAFLIPLVLLYLIRPRPVNVSIPSLMFILKDMGKSRLLHFFRSLLRDILLLLQLLAVLLLALTLAKPFIDVERESLVQQSILIVDVSASTRAFGDDTFETIRDAALERVTGDTVIILNQATPVILSGNGEPRLSAGDAKDLLEDLEPTDTSGDFPAALDMAAQYAGPESKVSILSDLVLSAREDPELVEARIKVLRSKGALVDVVPLGRTDGENTGIVGARVNAANASVDLKVQNFGKRPVEFSLEVNGDDLALAQRILAPAGQPGSLLTVTVPVGNGKNEIRLSPGDDLATDNRYYVSIPEQQTIRTLLVTNDERAPQSRVVPALQAAGDQFTRVTVEYATPPKVPDLDHDLYVLKDLNPQFVLPGIVSGLEEEVERGKAVVVIAQASLPAISWSTLLPVEPKQGLPTLSGRFDLIVNDSFPFMRGLSDLGQADGGQLVRVRARDDAVVYVSVGTNDGPEPVLAAHRIGRGAVIYYGIADRQAYDIDPQSYAVLWGRIVDHALVDPMSINLPAGTVLTGSSRIKTPDGTEDAPVVARTSGFYGVGSRTIATNLYGLERATATGDAIVAGVESAIAERAVIDADAGSSLGDADSQQVPLDLSAFLMMVGLALLGLELIYVKMRGDL